MTGGSPRLPVSVVGGGITGLAAAWELSGDDRLEVTVLEEQSRWGGKIATSSFAGRPVDEGADAFLRRVPEAIDLCHELGLDELTSPATGHAYVWADAAMHPIPGGLVLGVPAAFEDLDRSELLSPEGRARARREPQVEGEPVLGDCSIASLIDARFGPEVTDRLVEPLIGGIYAGEADRLSLDAVLPQLAEIAHTSAVVSTPLAERRSLTPEGPVFSAPTQGMGALVDALVDGLGRRGVHLVAGRRVESLPDGEAAIVTTPAPAAARLVRPLSAEAADLLDGIEYAGVVLVTLAVRRDDVGRTLDGSGFLVPRSAGLFVTAVSWSTAKWAHLDRGADDVVILRASSGHRDDTRALGMDDADVVAAMCADLRTTMGIHEAPIEVRVSRYPAGFPQYDVGHLDRVARIDAALATAAPHVLVTGSAMRGLGIPACIRQGRAAGRALIEGLVS